MKAYTCYYISAGVARPFSHGDVSMISSGLTLFTSLVSSYKNLFAIPNNSFESSHFLMFSLKRILVRIMQSFRLFNVQY